MRLEINTNSLLPVAGGGGARWLLRSGGQDRLQPIDGMLSEYDDTGSVDQSTYMMIATGPTVTVPS